MEETPPRPFYRGTVMDEACEFAIFASAELISKLPSIPNKRYHADGTIRVVPTGCFKQLFVIHLEFKDHVS